MEPYFGKILNPSIRAWLVLYTALYGSVVVCFTMCINASVNVSVKVKDIIIFLLFRCAIELERVTTQFYNYYKGE